MAIKSFLDLEVYQLAHRLAMKIFTITKSFPLEEKFALTDQIRRASRAAAALIAEGWGKRSYVNNFKRYLVDSNGEIEETKSWLLFSRDCCYISNQTYIELINEYEVLGSKLWRLHDSWRQLG